MIKDTISKIEEKINSNEVISNEKKRELLDLISGLKREIIDFSKDNEENALSIANFASISTHEAMKSEKNNKLLDISLTGLSESVTKFEISHPELTRAVNGVCNFLSNLGI